MTSPAAPPGRSPRVAAWCCTVLVLLLPAVVASRTIGDAPAPGELARLERVVTGRAPGAEQDTRSSQLFHAAAVAGARWPAEAAAQRALLVRARIAQVGGVVGLSILTYLMVLLAQGRLQALLACSCVALLPPVYGAGSVLRSETVGALFALVSVLLMQVAASPSRQLRGRQPRRAAALAGGLLLCAAAAIALTCEAVPSLGESLLVPGVVLTIAAVEMGVRARRLLRRRGLMGTPVRAINRRLIPWTALGFVAPACALFVLTRSYTGSVEALEVTARQSSLLPASLFGFTAISLLLGVGAVVMVARVGVRFGRGGQITPDLVLFSHCAVFLLAASSDHVLRDPLPLVPAAAAVCSAGAYALLVAAAGVLQRGRRRASLSRRY